ncbi:unnamed protein product [Protopolystoma xenopodis]|uniref:ABC transporter domain-containing protein n=1 Tax=Protopolystoma xenopodis TaxID=117903 RepID=A0A3S5FBS1_9PLAT|nr:unnamed protein product [Protopolystoma xenopodis]
MSGNGSIAYVPQVAWIQQHTLRSNVLFGAPFLPLWYRNVISACALLSDIERLPFGDDTEIGERGVNLSGGQRQRQSDIYFLDDPLSSVDAQVSEHLFNQVIGSTGLLCKKTRILVTSNYQLLIHADWILVFGDQGRIIQSGTYAVSLVHRSDWVDCSSVKYLSHLCHVFL